MKEKFENKYQQEEGIMWNRNETNYRQSDYQEQQRFAKTTHLNMENLPKDGCRDWSQLAINTFMYFCQTMLKRRRSITVDET